MHRRTQDPYAVLGVDRDAAPAEIAAAYRALVRELHPDNQHPSDPERLAQVVTAYQALRARRRADDSPGTRVEVHVRRGPPSPEPALRAGPVRRHGR
ncbi:curved DNA-binding protein/DnaJ family protein C member 16 [Actinokineospora alba]|uniref:Curved DNA-binding protein/DnaJ family protein C member 16 n=1 Tax=Actinokineospora alba TaxID=504798 RepID=A0A1H0EV00_9PSEU|nr:J domain-containing protein [Actinokineospora alba]TDP69235.1 DnaJ-like protein [Actinokineospora alba]SDI21284.1 curved DNA-binding protein/DnaJ family protein C member 16 [Actinokineospora alba]SDN86257.1 curved DNA-binding protein/DnaJ family protein C member 16 [Actinokineospora alba]